MSPVCRCVLLLSLLFLPAWGEEIGSARDVLWTDLKAEFTFEDPFEELEEEQLLDLGIIARVQSLEKRSASKVSDGMRKEAEEARARLLEQKVDIDGLFAKRAEITELRKKRAQAAVKELDGVLVALPGFVLPLEYEGKRVTEFLLVPWVGACIHTLPPPPNQIVHVIAKKPFETKGLFEAVVVTARMEVVEKTSELFLVDGTADISTSYGMSSAAVAKYEGPKK